MSDPHKCPCCDGYGYRTINPVLGYVKVQYEICVSCMGAGLVWDPEPVVFTHILPYHDTTGGGWGNTCRSQTFPTTLN